MKKFIFFVGFCFLIFSCSDVKRVQRGNTFYKVEPIEGENHKLQIHKVQQSFLANLTEKDGFLIIKPVAAKPPTTVIDPAPTIKFKGEREFHFPNLNDPSPLVPHRFIYQDLKPFLQALTIPIKIRPKIKDRSLKDSFPATVESGFNVAIALGLKMTKNIYRSEKNVLGQTSNKISVSPGILFGAGAADLKKTTTRDPVIQFERRAPMLTFGAFVMFGFNQVNIGYSVGFDNALGKDRSTWVYQGKLWHGVTIGLDIIK